MAAPTPPATTSSLCRVCREKRLRDLQKRLEKWWRSMSRLRRTGMGRVCRWLNSMGTLLGRLQTSLRRMEDQQTVWAEPHETWSTWTPSGIGIRWREQRMHSPLSSTHTHTHTLSLMHALPFSLTLSLTLTHTLPLSLSLSHTHTHARTHTRTHAHTHTRARMHARTHAHAHTQTHTQTHTPEDPGQG